ncbi:TRAP transporter small permease [Pseudocolwellia sp. HL-MZ19]|uniref:TRAP transporter small permease n=1 Tax=unclassified Pseudocolwellia TaxID=2848178 RepID=UPI003CF17567
MTCYALILNKIDQRLQQILVLLLVLLVVDVSWQVLTRFILPQPSSFTEELARFLLIWLSLLGGSYAYRQNLHLGFDLVIKYLPTSTRAWIQRFNCLLIAIFAIAILIVGGTKLVILTWILEQHSPVLNIPMAAVYLVIPLSGILFLLFSIESFFSVNDIAIDKET